MSDGGDGALWLSEQEVAALVGLADAVAAVRSALADEAAGRAATMGKTHITWDGHTLHALGGRWDARGLVATKSWAHTAGGAEPMVLVWDQHEGRLLACIEAFVLGQLRTAAVSAVATDALAPPEARTMAMIGTGRQALPQVAAVLAVRDVTEVRVHSPDADHRRRFAEELAGQTAAEVTVWDSVAEAVAGAAVVTTATRARLPFLSAAMLGPGAHVNAVGAITPERREVADDVVARCRLVASDSPEAALRLSAEVATAPAVTALSEVVAAGDAAAPGATGAGGAAGPGGDLSLFKAMGIGLADLAVAAEALTRAEAAGAGRRLPARSRARPRLLRSHQEANR
ncbi:MAG TPA: hypothetical protein VFH45_01230 [Acidimicrobiales bacterium]|nr:hypothetical protein [Acidimicrobiales bacterium]